MVHANTRIILMVLSSCYCVTRYTRKINVYYHMHTIAFPSEKILLFARNNPFYASNIILFASS